MTGTLGAIYRHPLKAIGREALDRVGLTQGQPLPWDRAFAMAHARARPDDLHGPWAHKMNYLRGVTGPQLMAVSCTFDETRLQLTLHHPGQDSLTVDLSAEDSSARLAAWLEPLWPEEAPRPTRLVHHAGRAQTDVPDPWLSLHTVASHRAVAQKLGRADLSIHRWRGNLWIDGVPLWDEFDWVGKHVRIGSAVLKVECPITRCKATMANPETGRRDADTLGALEAGWGHTDFGVYAAVVESGPIALGDTVEVLA